MHQPVVTTCASCRRREAEGLWVIVLALSGAPETHAADVGDRAAGGPCFRGGAGDRMTTCGPCFRGGMPSAARWGLLSPAWERSLHGDRPWNRERLHATGAGAICWAAWPAAAAAA